MVSRLNTETLTDQTTTPKHLPNPKTIEMITANELRIGNYVSEYGETTVVGLSTFGLYQEMKGIMQSSITPIPLTEEWLIRFGFEKQMAWTYRIHLSGNNYLVYYLGEKGWSINNKNYSDFSCQYVHQLQNLYFALTQTELTTTNP